MGQRLNLPQADESLICEKHGLRLGTPKNGTCNLCRTTCEGCGGPVEFPHLEMNSGTKFFYEDPHKDCGKDLKSFWIKRPV